MIKPLFGSNLNNKVLQTALEGHAARHRAVVNNIANVDTPGYRRIEVDFEKQLSKAIQKERRPKVLSGNESARETRSPLSRFKPTVEADDTPPVRYDGSNVQIDREMVDLTRNSGRLMALTELLARDYRQIRMAINGR